MQITPKGTVTYQGNPYPSQTFFRFVSGPAGYSTAAIPAGGSLTLKSSGTYVLGIMQSNSATGCYLATDTIYYTVKPLSLDVNVTSAYVCVGGGAGHISIRAINGTAPFTYELWNEANSVNLNQIPSIQPNGTAHFTYGTAGTTYTVRVKDDCNSSFSQKVTLTNLETARIVYVPDGNNICPGGTLELKCITLGTTTYSWTGPNGFTSNQQNPVLVNFNKNMEGKYSVSVTPQFCGTAVKDTIEISMYDTLRIE